ncbi:adenine phosphoribosyltransferase [Tribolium castaneum]|uniref:Adenine phosphoribosyltransferase n=1 Tax=Tribolium castaneum TaxID=7070 RepID=D6WSW8_TRICA|nr:PREDICTED: adenine phosphoribosyltransferase [Tribolium castaneum]EFA06669.1 Adenine phosphoribosyltransferase-like Protein [Tribolium castaneum]|eukprot:XP_968297.1 PREDICTED: adenine phosphoribosyltransferase [Tribolium castaneum]
MSDLDQKIAQIKANVTSYPDFPKPGILFRDLFSVFQKPELIAILRDVLVSFARKIEPPAECIVGLDARGFLLGPLMAIDLNIPFVPIRKKGKLPGKILSAQYALEYGHDTVEIQENSISKGQRVLLVDDLLATGGSLGAACQLVRGAGGEVAGCLVLMELEGLKGREKVPAEVLSIIKY